MNKNFFSQDVFQKNGIYFIGVFLLLFIGLGLQEYYGKTQLQLMFNQYHNQFWDEFFKYYTVYSLPFFIGIAFIIIIKNYNYKMLAYLLSAILFSSIIMVYVKKTYFIHGHRPTEYFKNLHIPIHTVDGVKDSITYTYPSGHSCLAFLIMLFFSMLYIKNKWLQLLFFVLAFLVAYSRIYLSKHFMVDTLGGLSLGIFGNVLMYYIFKNIDNPKLDKKIIPA